MSHILIAGCGIFGVTAALELRSRGHAVTVLDPGPLPHPDAASTDISKVIRMDYGEEDFYMDLMEAAFPGWEAWNAAWPRPLYHQTGMLFLSSRPLERGGFEYESLVRLQRRGHPVERLDPAALRARFPDWDASHIVDGYFNPRAGWAESGEVVAQLVQLARAAGVTFHIGAAFAGTIENGGRVAGVVSTQGERYPADFVILAAGSWTPVLLPGLEQLMWPVGQPVFHFRPQDFTEYQPPRFPVWAADIHEAAWYGFPARDDGILKIAHHGPGLRRDPRLERQVPAEEEARFRRFLRWAIPSLADAPLAGTRLCFYCDTFDGDFWIDHHPQREGLLVCAGGSGHAFKFAPVLGAIIADVLERRPNPFAPRFAWRQSPAGQEVQTAGEGSATPRK